MDKQIFISYCHRWPILGFGRHVRDRKVVYLGETHGEPAVVGLHTAVLNTLVSQVHDSKREHWLFTDQNPQESYESLTSHRRQKKEVQMQEFQSLWSISVLNIRLFQRVPLIYSKFAFSLKPNQHQDLLDRFQAGEVKEEELQEQYDRCSPWKRRVIWTNAVFRLGDEGFLLAPYSPLLRLAKKHSKTVKLKGGFVPKRYAKILMKEGEEEAYKQVWPELKLA